MISNRVEGKGKGKGLLNRAPQLRWWLGISFIPTPSQVICYLFHPIRRILYTCIVGINKTSNCFSRQSYWKKNYFTFLLTCQHESKDLGFVFPVISEDITKESKSFLLPWDLAAFTLQTKPAEPESWGWKVPIKRRSQRYRTGAGLYRFYHSVPAEAYQLLQREVQEALQKAIMK